MRGPGYEKSRNFLKFSKIYDMFQNRTKGLNKHRNDHLSRHFAAEMYVWGQFGSYMMEFGRSGGENWEVRAAEKVENLGETNKNHEMSRTRAKGLH